MDRVTQADIDPRDQDCVREDGSKENESVFPFNKSLSKSKSFFDVEPRSISTDSIPVGLGGAARKRFCCTLL